MRRLRPTVTTILNVAVLVSVALPLAGQEARYLSVGFSAGPAGVQPRMRNGDWAFGPFIGGRVEWGNRQSALFMAIDAQPFRAEGDSSTGDFRAVYFLPAFAMGSGGRRIGFGLGLGLFDLEGGAATEGIKAGFVTGASGSVRLSPFYFLELGWKRVNNVEGLRANVWSLQLVRRWRLGGR